MRLSFYNIIRCSNIPPRLTHGVMNCKKLKVVERNYNDLKKLYKC